MKNLIRHRGVVAIICTFVICVPSVVFAQLRAEAAPQQASLQSQQPGGFLSNRLGAYLTIEGVLYDGNGKVESNSLVVDMVNGKRLEKSVLILVRNVRLPVKERCTLKGYELGEMIGSPPALREAAEEQSVKYEERSSAVWRWRPYFVVLIAAKPDGLVIQTK